MTSSNWEDILNACILVEEAYSGNPTEILVGPPADPSAVDSIKHTKAFPFVPEQYESLLLSADGAFLLPWDEDGTAGVDLFSIHVVEEENERAYSTLPEPVDPACRPYFIVGKLTSASSDFLGIDETGAVWWLEHQSGLADWRVGIGCMLVAKDLRAFVSRLAKEKGSWWWLPGFPSTVGDKVDG